MADKILQYLTVTLGVAKCQAPPCGSLSGGWDDPGHVRAELASDSLARWRGQG